MQVATPRTFCSICGEPGTIVNNTSGISKIFCRACYKDGKAKPQSLAKFASGLGLDDED